LHPAIRRIASASSLWTIGAVWVLFSHSYYGPLLYGVVTLLVAFSFSFPLSSFAWRDRAPRIAELRDLDAWPARHRQRPVDARVAAIAILLIPIAVPSV